LRCGVCRQRCRKVHNVRKAREWRDLSMRRLPLKLRYRPRRVACPRCGLRVEDFPWAEPWARVTTALSNAVSRLARELSWQGTARQVRTELEERRHHREAGGGIWLAPSRASAGPYHWHR
jgi:transposase